MPKIDPTAYPIDKGPKESSPKACKSAYEAIFPKVAVVNFTNNSTFDCANVVQFHVQGSGQRTAVGGAAVGAVPGAVGVVWGSKEKHQFQRDSETTQRQDNAKLSKWFTVKGYIRQLRTRQDEKERFANLNIDKKVGLKPGPKLIAYTFEEMEDEDPVSGSKKITCNIVKLPVELAVTDQIQAESAWTTIEGKPQDMRSVKVGQLVERQPLGGQGFMKKMGY